MKKTYQIDQQRATQRFRKEAGASNEKLQLALPLPEVRAAWSGLKHGLPHRRHRY